MNLKMNKELENNSMISHYRIISKIGKGGMGEVYLAEDTKLDRQVALKILPAEFAEDTDRMSRFVREAKSASALNHPNIITIYEIGEANETHYIATEFIDGKTLGDYAESKSFKINSILDIAIQVASALDEAHSAGIVHRDIKPDNIMVRKNGFVKILDFGIAKLTTTPTADGEAATAIQSQTQAGMIIGTPNYMSPEQARGKGVDGQTDIFSFGVVLYEMLSGSSPFAGDTVSDVIAAVLTKEPKSLSGIPPELEEIVFKTLQKDKKQRYQTAKDLLQDLKKVKQELEINRHLGRTSSPNLEEPKTQILKAVTDEKSPSNLTDETAKSIAVLPFTNMSADEENEYFCDGLAEELLNALSKIEDLKVAARTSAFSFKGKNANVSEIGEKLSVENVLEGSVRKSGDKLRISIQLVNASDGYQIWSERYDREMKDIFDVQDEITLAVVDALKLQLFGDEKATVLKHGTRNKEAYDLYLKARFFFNKFTDASFEQALELYKQAIAIDVNYAKAYVGIGEIYFYQSLPDVPMAKFSPEEAIPKITAAAEKAIQMDENLAEAWALLAHIKEKTWDFQGAKEAYRRSFALDGNYPTTHSSYGIFLSALGKDDEAVKETLLAQKLDPFSAMINTTPLICLYFARRYEEAIYHWERITELELTFPAAGSIGGLAYVETKRYAEAIKIFREAIRNSNRSNTALACLGHALAVSGEKIEVNEILNELLKKSKTSYVSSYGIALVYTGMGEKDKAIESLIAACEERNLEIVFLNVEPRFDPLRDDPRFQEIISLIGFTNNEANRNKEILEAKTAMLQPDSAEENAEVEQVPESTDNPKSKTPNPKSKWWLFGLLSLIFLTVGFFAFNYFLSGSNQIESIAVMPFVNESGNEDVEYLSDGMTETLINSLTEIPNLSVKARSSVFYYKGKNVSPKQIGEELNVEAVLLGRVTQRGDRIKLNLALVDTKTLDNLWSASYDRKQSDLVTLQSEIAKDVSTKIKSKLSGADEEKVTKASTVSPEAYQAYLKGRYYWNRRTAENIKKAIEQFKVAIDRDPNYALAYAGLADSYALLPEYAGTPVSESAPQAREYAKRAIALDNQLGEPHAALGMVAQQLWQWEEAEKEYKRAIEINPNYATAFHWYSILLKNLGRYDEAEKTIKRAYELDPLSYAIGCNISMIYLVQNDNESSAKNSLKLIELDPTFGRAYEYLGLAYLKLGRKEEAVKTMEKAVELTNRQNVVLSELGYVYGRTGNRERALAVAKELEAKYARKEAAGHEVAAVYSGLGEKDKAFEWLEKDFQAKDGRLNTFRWETQFEPLRDDPRFKDLLKRMNLPE